MTKCENTCGPPPGIQTPSYILSPLDSGDPENFVSSECPFLFLLSFLSGHSETPPETAVYFFFLLVFRVQM